MLLNLTSQARWMLSRCTHRHSQAHPMPRISPSTLTGESMAGRSELIAPLLQTLDAGLVFLCYLIQQSLNPSAQRWFGLPLPTAWGQ